VQTVPVAVSLLVQTCTLSGCSFPFFDGGSSRSPSTTTTASTTSTSSSSTSTSSGSAECTDATAVKKGYRPDAASRAQEDISDDGACCEACQADKRCWVWSFQTIDNTCYFTDKAAPFGIGDYNTSTQIGEIGIITAPEFIMGVKRSGTCDGCWEHPEWGGGCGRAEGDHSQWKDCAKCDDPDNWAEYPCFLANGCACGGDQQFPLPSEGPSTGPPDEEGGGDGDWDGGDDGWEAFVNNEPLTI
jgi:hypothetical protein